MTQIVAPGTDFEASLNLGITGQVGTLQLGIYDGDTAVQALGTADINEVSASGVYVATRTAPARDQSVDQYLLIWSDDGSLDPARIVHVEDLVVSGFGVLAEPSGDSYAAVEELARILRVDAVARSVSLQRVLVTAAGEIDSEVGRGTADPLTGWELALAAEVNLERAVEHWQQMQSPFGIVGLGADTLPTITGRDSWDRHAHKLAAVKRSWGLA